MWHAFCKGVDLSENGQALDAFLTNEPGTHFLGHAHTLANFETAFYRSPLADSSSFEQWEAGGCERRGAARKRMWKRALAEYEQPPLDDAIEEELDEWIERRRRRSRTRTYDDASPESAGPPPLRGHPARRNRGGRARARPDRGDADGHHIAGERPRADARADERLAEHGYRVVPHLAARHVRDRGHLAELVERLRRDRARATSSSWQATPKSRPASSTAPPAPPSLGGARAALRARSASPGTRRATP